MNKKYIIWFIVIAVVVIGGILIYIFRCKLFPSLSSCVEDPNKNDTPVPPGSSSTTWIPETPPYNVGMFGPKIKALQSALGISADGKFGNQTKAAIISAGYAVPLSSADYDKIIAGKDTSNPIGKTVYAKFSGVKVYKADNSVYKTATKDEYIGVISGEYAADPAYWLISSGLYHVNKTSVYWK